MENHISMQELSVKKVSSKSDTEVKRIIDEAYSRMKDILRENMQRLHNVANALLEKERLEGFNLKRYSMKVTGVTGAEPSPSPV